MGYTPIRKPKDWSNAEYRAYLQWALDQNPLERLGRRLWRQPARPKRGLADVLAEARVGVQRRADTSD